MAVQPLPTQPETLDDQEVVAANIRALMARFRVSQEDLAEVIGVQRPAMSKRLAGKTDISVRELGLIARYFGKSMEDLVTVGKLTVVDGGQGAAVDNHQRPLPFLSPVS